MMSIFFHQIEYGKNFFLNIRVKIWPPTNLHVYIFSLKNDKIICVDENVS